MARRSHDRRPAELPLPVRVTETAEGRLLMSASLVTQEAPRRHQRVEAERPARLLHDGRWHDVVILNISGGGASLGTALKVRPGATAVLSEAELGLMAGTVVRRDGETLCLSFGIDEKRRLALIDKLTMMANVHLFE